MSGWHLYDVGWRGWDGDNKPVDGAELAVRAYSADDLRIQIPLSVNKERHAKSMSPLMYIGITSLEPTP